jgi:parallel beta-helix repeat protein
VKFDTWEIIVNPRYASLFLSVILCLSVLQPTITISSREPLVSYSVKSSEYYTAHGPVNIDADQDFIDYGFPGDGSAENPYRLERLNITSSASLGKAVSVRDTHSYFIIRDCCIVSEYIGIALLDVTAGTGLINNNTLISASGGGGGITVDTVNCTISDNRCANWAQGIHLNQASQCIISRNNVSDSTYQGINIRYSDNNTIIGNRIINSTQHGLVFVGTSGFNVVYNNTFISNGNVAEYTIDNDHSGSLHSQGYDEGSDNIWYDMGSKTGNIWSDYPGFGSYTIDGPANSFDLYPTSSQPSQVYIIIAFSTALVLTIFLSVFGYRRLHK